MCTKQIISHYIIIWIPLKSFPCLFFSYFSQLSDCGQKLGMEVRRSYHELVFMLVEAVQGFSSLNEKYVPHHSGCIVHVLQYI